MNYPLIQEILQLKQAGKSNTEVADLIGSNKTIITITLRVHSEVEQHFKETMDKLSEANTALIEEIKTLKAQVSNQQFELEQLQNLDTETLTQEIRDLRAEIEEYKDDLEVMDDQLYKFQTMTVFQFIKTKFDRGV